MDFDGHHASSSSFVRDISKIVGNRMEEHGTEYVQ